MVWLRETENFPALELEVLTAAPTEPYESTNYQGIMDFHWKASSLPEAKQIADTLKHVARHPEVVLLRIMSQVDGVDSISIKDDRQTKA